MESVTLQTKSVDGELLTATYTPSHGMNLLSFKKGVLEVIDQETKPLFEERFAGLGALIGPHFHRRKPETIPVVKEESLFPHIALVKAKGVQEPFSHGIARYAPWSCEQLSVSSLKSTLTGKDEWKGVPLSELEGQDFEMHYHANLSPDGLHIDYTIVSDSASVIGFHYYYSLPRKSGSVYSQDIRRDFRAADGNKPIPDSWQRENALHFPLTQSADYGFYPSINPLHGKVILDAEEYTLSLSYESPSQENSWQLYHPEGATFVCIEPLSAQDPRKPILSVNSLKLHLNIS